MGGNERERVLQAESVRALLDEKVVCCFFCGLNIVNLYKFRLDGKLESTESKIKIKFLKVFSKSRKLFVKTSRV